MTFYFAWVNQTDTTFSSSFERHDESVLSFKREHTEGQIPTLSMEIKNPRIGLLHTGRKVWAWLSWRNPANTVIPLFFGRLVGIPTDMFAEVVTLQFIARPVDYVKQKQTVAETMKVRPYWEPVFLDPQKRDDPDSILEGWASLWHVDPVTQQVTASSIIVGEDGNVVFTGDGDAIYDSVKSRLNQPPLTAVQVDATVSWNQTAIGTVDMGTNIIRTYTGDGLIKEWPKPLTSIGGGWTVQYSRAADQLATAYALSASMSGSWKNTDTIHQDGDLMSSSVSSTFPSQTGLETVLTTVATTTPGPNGEGKSAESLSQTFMYTLQWQIGTALTLRYDANRQRTERVIFMLTADMQDIITSPLVTQNSELITKHGCDVGVPIFNVLNWTSVSGHFVDIGQVIFPDNPLLPGGTSGQICIVAGTAGTVEPVFSDVPGAETVDNTVTWASLGATSVGAATDWAAESFVGLGSIILPKRPLFDSWFTITQDGRMAFPQVGGSVGQGAICQASNGSFQVCYLPGITGLVEPAFSTVWGVETFDGSVTWISLGMSLPTGTNYFICTQSGTTGPVLQIPSFNNALHGTTSDGSVIWTCIGSGDIPAGGYPTQVHARSYFPTDRGLWSVEYLISVARARLLMRSRAVELSWECPFEYAVPLTCRKTATLFDPRLPGGQGTGKIISCTLEADKGVLKGSVTIACSVGNGGSVVVADGTPLYVEEGYFDVGKVQAYTNRVVSVSSVDTDVGYSPPVDAVDDDGLWFPLNKDQIVVTEAWRGDLGSQVAAARRGMSAAAYAAQFALGINNPFAALNPATPLQIARVMAEAGAYGVGFQLSQAPIWYDLEIKPVVNGPFFAEYPITVTKLNVPKMIDLGAASI